MEYLGKLLIPLDNRCGWLMTIITYILTFLGPGAYMVVACMLMIVLDAIFGVWASLKSGRSFESRVMREGVTKVFVYIGIQLGAILLDKVVGTESLCIRIVTALIVVGELWSILGNISIIHPNFPVVKLLKKYLAGEIANKTNMDKEEVERILNQNPDADNSNKEVPKE